MHNKIYPYAGFWKRVAAALIDRLILAIPCLLVAGLLLAPLIPSVLSAISAASAAGTKVNLPPDMVASLNWRGYFLQLLNIVIYWLYFAYMESGPRQATWGKRALGIKVVGADGNRISFARATGRRFASFVSGIPMYFGFFMAGFTQKRQALHDLMADTYVVQKEYQSTEPLSTLPFSKGGCIAGVLVAVSPFILFFLMTLTAIGLIATGSLQPTARPPQTVQTSNSATTQPNLLNN